ncbi:MAG: rod shape-determining protein RodA [Ignavibacteriaceae bacterium]|nr:MAG: rod shape-determining protein RodA [Chlorobiota bacterium]MBV6399374.1 Peptidoglycan glycosyltransferase MrdB [Ignavibacteria bacterium]MCC6886873.1 rod shape-determining protein RodA [Ignavibacteriales bacterium]MCE7953928.1 rod shape-determining protein RodA [Chlorobi bacterium CHB7]MDL1887861.1 rod shape-determining protein RodA [Ignavibacteria bacterium CHB1]MEB2330508.1 rod shape-determining protein RodA [Ignavibacteriaceae bacterium]RIK47947.1 MAG: rod shape-determining protein 
MSASEFFKKFDLTLVLATISLITLGVFAIFSATSSSEFSDQFYERHMIFGIAGVVMMLVISYLPPKHLEKVSSVLYVLSLLLLVSVLIFGKKISGQRSWFSFGGFGIQPAEFAKVATVMIVAFFLSKDSEGRNSKLGLKDTLVIAGLVLLPVALIALQPDTGTNLVFLSILIPVFLWAGMPAFFIVALIAPVIVAISAFLSDIVGNYLLYVVLAITAIGIFLFKEKQYLKIGVIVLCLIAGFGSDYVYDHLETYQQKRIMSVFDPTSDPRGSGYNVIQSKVAIGSGGLFGKGYMQGTQTQLNFIPAQWTDFIFCMVGEEFGFIGSVVLIILYLVIVIKLINNGYNARSRFLSLACIGFASVFLFHLFINIGMTVGILPVIGIPLPLLSYGVSSLLSFTIMLGIGMNAYRNRNIVF